jgi:GNAT superfamily N-acetyltransferase
MRLTRVSEYDLAVLQSFFQPFRFTIAVEALLEGSLNGSIWMDNLTHPTFVVLWDFADGVYIISLEKTSEHLNILGALFQDEIIPQAERQHEAPMFVIYILPEHNENEIRGLFDSRWIISKQKASFYEFPHTEFPSKHKVHRLPPSLESNLMDMDLLWDSSIKNIGILIEEIESDWGSIENFLAHSFGYYIKDLNNNTLVSWVLVENIARSCAEFAIETDEQYQRQGLAQFAAQEMIKYTLERGLVPHWYCFQSNVPSVGLVEKLGFRKMHDFEVHVIQKQ